jgi:hypothetical protein
MCTLCRAGRARPTGASASTHLQQRGQAAGGLVAVRDHVHVAGGRAQVAVPGHVVHQRLERHACSRGAGAAAVTGSGRSCR